MASPDMHTKRSPDVARLFEELHQKRNFWQPDRTRELINRIADFGELSSISDLLPFLVHADREVQLAAAAAIDRLVKAITPAGFARFDDLMRQGYADWNPRNESWSHIKPEQVHNLAKFQCCSVSVLGVTASHRNGHVRQAAIRELGKINSGEELPFLLNRVNDWVNVVSDEARDQVMLRVRRHYLSYLQTWLPLVLRLGQARRRDHSTLTRAVAELFGIPEAREMLYEGLESDDRRVRCFCFEIALQSDTENFVELLRRGFASKDLLSRRSAMRSLRSSLPSSVLFPLLDIAVHNSSASIRREALLAYQDFYPSEAERRFQEALLDQNISIREQAQFYLHNHSTLNLRAFYVESIKSSSGARRAAAIAGLGETGVPADVSVLDAFLATSSSRVRAEALRARIRLDPHTFPDRLVEMLADESSKVSIVAVRALGKRANSVGGEDLWSIFARSHRTHVRRGILFLLARITKWDSITYLIQSLESDDEYIRSLSSRYIQRWIARYNRSLIVPNSAQKERLRMVVMSHGMLMSPRLLREVESLLS